MEPIKIIKRTTGIIIDCRYNEDALRYFRPLAKELTQITTRWDRRENRMVKELKNRWYRYEKETGRLLFPAFMELELRSSLEHQNVKYHWDEQSPSDSIATSMEMASTFKYRPGQETFVDFLVNWDSYTRVLPATMGAGKTVSSLAAIARMQETALCIIPASLVDEWVDTIKWATTLTDDEYIFISGGESLKAYMRLIMDEPNPIAVTLISINTLQAFLNNYLEDDYPLTPFEFFDKGGFGIKVVDEAHRSQHFHMTTNLYSNIKNNLYLTATLMKEDAFEANIENKMYPRKDRCPVPEPSNHVLLRSYHYKVSPNTPPHIGAMGYSHAKMEKAFEKRKISLRAYIQMVKDILHRDYGEIRNQGDKALVFFSKVELVKLAHKELKARYPELNVIIYGAGDSKSILKDADIIVSTVKKAGTGTDIPVLTYVLQTIPISAKGENFQNVGRLRNLSDKETIFAYLVCDDIKKHKEYHEKRQRELTPLVHKKESIMYPTCIPFK